MQTRQEVKGVRRQSTWSPGVPRFVWRCPTGASSLSVHWRDLSLSPSRVLWAAPLTAGSLSGGVRTASSRKKREPRGGACEGVFSLAMSRNGSLRRHPGQVAGAQRGWGVGSVCEGTHLGLVSPGRFALDLL